MELQTKTASTDRKESRIKNFAMDTIHSKDCDNESIVEMQMFDSNDIAQNTMILVIIRIQINKYFLLVIHTISLSMNQPHRCLREFSIVSR